MLRKICLIVMDLLKKKYNLVLNATILDLGFWKFIQTKDMRRFET